MTTETYKIITMCDPYNARHHYHGEEVVFFHNGTPCAWVEKDTTTYQTLEDAKEALWNTALENLVACGECTYENDYTLEDLILIAMYNKGIAYDEAKECVYKWYQGEGIYYRNEAVMLKGDMSYPDDSLLTSICSSSYLMDKYQYQL